jgi:AraC-like DNA-binding protein
VSRPDRLNLQNIEWWVRRHDGPRSEKNGYHNGTSLFHQEKHDRTIRSPPSIRIIKIDHFVDITTSDCISGIVMLRYLQVGERDFSNFPDIMQKRLNWEVFSVFSGRCHPQFEPRRKPLTKDPTLWIIPPGLPYRWECDSVKCVRAVLHFAFVPPLVETAARKHGYLSCRLSAEESSRVRELAERCVLEFKKPSQLSSMVYELALLEFSIMALSRHELQRQFTLPNIARERTESAMAYYQHHMVESLTLEQVAAEMHVSPGHLRRHFYEVMHCSPKEAFTRLRLQRSKELLSTSSHTLDAVAEQCGFGSATDLCRTFRKAFGVTPDVWRRKVSTTRKISSPEHLAERRS